MTSAPDTDANKPPTHGNSGEGTSSIVPHLPDSGEQQQLRPPKLEDPAGSESAGGGPA